MFVDPHHDVWSRWTGGDGAPFWCFDLVGLAPEHFVEAGAVGLDAQDWSENYQRVPVATMWTLFYGGDTFCPELAGVQQELQDRYIGAVAAVAERIAHLDNVLGYDTLNEPGNGYIGRSARSLTTARRFFDQDGPAPWSPLEHLAAGDGVTVRREDGEVLNPNGRSIWRHGCPWQRAGIWTLDRDGRPELAAPDRFRELDGRRINPFGDFHVPFIRRFRERLRDGPPRLPALHRGLTVGHRHAVGRPRPARRQRPPLVRHRRPRHPHGGRPRVPRAPRTERAWPPSTARSCGALAKVNEERMGGPPMLLGEYGIPYEMNGGAAFADGDFSLHERLLHAMYEAMDELFMSGTQWNYTPDNTHAHGDQWNHEDLSVYCAEDGGGRAVAGFSRPYARHSQGRPTTMRFDPSAARFELVLDASSLADGPDRDHRARGPLPGRCRGRGVGRRGDLRPGASAGLLDAVRAGGRGPADDAPGLSSAAR